jgi:hypothetical protein
MKQYNIISSYGRGNDETFYIETSSYFEKNKETKFIDIDIFHKYNKLKEENRNNKLKENDIVYFSPFTEYPLYKFKEYINDSKLNINRVTKYKDSNTVILNDNIIQNLYCNSYYSNKNYYIIPNDLYYNSFPISKPMLYENRYIEDTDKDFIYCVYDDDQPPIIFKNLKTVKGIKIDKNWGNIKSFLNVEMFEQIINDYNEGKINIIFDDKINEDININNNIDINIDIINNIIDMINSKDDCNIDLAKEIIANLDFKEIKPFLLYICHTYPEFPRLNNKKNWKYVIDELKPDKSIYKLSNLQNFILKISKEYPNYLPLMFKYMAVMINKLNNKELIKDIIIT